LLSDLKIVVIFLIYVYTLILRYPKIIKLITFSLRKSPVMKRLDIIIPHERLSEVNNILHKHKVGGITFYDIKGRGRAKQEPVAVGRGVMRYVPEFGSRTKIEVLVTDSLSNQIIDDLLKEISTGSSSDGKIFVYDVAEAYDIGSKESSDIAL
jgi:nitrogen regulatory protein P-II 1